MTRPGTSALTYTALRLAGQACEFAGFLILARALEPDGFGRLSVAFIVCRYAGVIADWGALSRGARDVSIVGAEHDRIRTLLRVRAWLAVAAAGLIAAGLVVTGHPALAPLVATTLALGLNRDWVALGSDRRIVAAVPTALQGTVLVLAAFAGRSPAVGAIVIGGAYLCGLTASLTLNRLPAPARAVPIRVPDAWLLVGLVAIQFTSSGDAFLLAALRSAGEAGIYTAVYRIPNAWVAVLTAAMGIAVPAAARAAVAGQAARHHRRTRRRASVLAALVAAAAPLSWFAVPIVFGDAYASGRAAAVILVVSTAVVTFSMPFHIASIARGADRAYAVVVVAGAVVNLALNVVLIPPHGMAGAATATLIAQVLITALLASAGRRPSPTPAVGEDVPERAHDDA